MPDANIPQLNPCVSGGPTVSIIMPTFRRAHSVGKSIRTLLEGTWQDFELLVRDDGDGLDGTAAAVSEAAQGDTRVFYHRNETPLRMPGNLNAGIAESRGEFIAVCHDHDLYEPLFLEKMITALRRNPSALFVHCAIDEINDAGKHLKSHIGDWPELTPGKSWLKVMLQSLNCPVCALTVVRRNAHEKFGLYDVSCGFISDVEMWMRLSTKGDVAYVNKPLINVMQREVGHAETANGDKWIRMAASIHRRFLAEAYRKRTRALRRVRLELEFSNQYLRHQAGKVVRKLTENDLKRNVSP